MEERAPPFIVGGTVNWYNHYGKQYGCPSEEQREVPYDQAILLLVICPDKTFIENDTCTMFTATLFTIVKTQK